MKRQDHELYNLAHPGEILKELVLTPLGLSVTEAADHLGVSRKTLSKVLNGRGTVTPEMALRLEMAFGKPDAAHWLRLQNAYDLWHARRHSQGKRSGKALPSHGLKSNGFNPVLDGQTAFMIHTTI